ncbi:MAG: hypothetical protein AB7O66_10705 [Limisphaerales bacterium]
MKSIPSPAPVLAALVSGIVALGTPLQGATDPSTPADQAPESPPAPSSETSATPETSKPAEPSDAAEAAEPVEDTPGFVDAAPGDYRNWFDVTVGGLLVDGDDAPARRRLGLPSGAFGGAQRFHFEQDVGDQGIFKVDGRGIFNNEDYGLRLEWSETDKAFVRAGIDQYRTFSDGSGGWFPGNDLWFDLYDDELALVRGSAFFEAGLRLPNYPEITVRYERDWREGQKDSTHWGDSGLTGGFGPRAIVPSFRTLDETTDTVSIEITKTLGKVTFGGAFAYEHSDIDNGTYLRRSPTEDADRHITQRESVETDLYSARAFADTIFNEKVRVTSSYAFTTLETALGGSRIVGADYDGVYDPVYGRRDIGFLGLSGGSQLDQHVWNVNGLWTPIPNLAVIPAFRLENQSLDGSSGWSDTGAETLAREAANSRDMLDLSQQLELRYTGVTNVVFYARGDWIQGDGNLLEHQFLPATGVTEIHRDSDFDRFSQKYTAGTHWYPLKRLNVHAQYYRKMRSTDYDHDASNRIVVSGYYPAYIQNQNFTTDDLNLRVTWRPLDQLTLVSRYDLQFNTYDSQATGFASTQGAEGTAHILSETLTWTPVSRFYLQPGVHLVFDTTRSDASSAVAPGSPVEDAHNDYVSVTCTAGLVIDERTDLQAQYTYYLADNFQDVSAATQPYGSGLEEHGILTSLVRRISPRLRVTLRYGFYTSREELSGGHNDYDAHLVSTSAQYLF